MRHRHNRELVVGKFREVLIPVVGAVCALRADQSAHVGGVVEGQRGLVGALRGVASLAHRELRRGLNFEETNFYGLAHALLRVLVHKGVEVGVEGVLVFDLI